MKPVRLVMKAFGPFAGETSVDFRDLRGREFFLITGPTGAGKTTLLDAMTFALFGETSGGERDGREMRSHHAPDDLLTEVTFDFTIGAESYRVTRVPEQLRPARRGTGMVKQLVQATLWRRTGLGGDAGEGAVLAARWSEVTSELERILGFRADQFRQVVLLPQGRFRRFLSATSAEREEILQSLFGTGFYEKLEQALREAAGALKKDLDRLKVEEETLLGGAPARTVEEIEAHRESERARREALAGEVADRRGEETRLAEEIAAVRDIAARCRERDGAQAALAACERELPAMREKEEGLALARRALPLAPLEGSRALREEEWSEARKEVGARGAEHAASLRELALAKAAWAEERSREAARKAAAEEARRLEGLAERTRDLEALRRTAAEAAARHEASARNLGALRRKREALEKAWLDGQAAVLAAGLEAGAPCPVCGATDHPSPARASGALPGEEAVKSARADVERVETLERGTREEAAKASALAAEREREVPEALRAPGALERARAEARRASETLERQFEEAREREARGSREATRTEAAFRAATEAERTAGRRAGEAVRAFERALIAAGFADAESWRAARRPAEAIGALEEEVREFHRAHAAGRDRLHRAEEAARGLEPRDVGPLEEAHRAVKADLDRAVREEVKRAESVDRLNGLLRSLARIAGRRGELEAEYAVVGGVAGVANGQNPHRMTFQRFVLRSLLDDVLVVASARLGAMSRGRYALRMSRGRGDGRMSGGLELEVDDAHTGRSRSVATLSGGEGFLASLSLALALADVVQARAGGIRLETIFVDEGFGTLDEEVLDLAVRTLTDLRRGGRLVGVISHVQELRERVDTRLEVSAGTGGSRARFVLGAC